MSCDLHKTSWVSFMHFINSIVMLNYVVRSYIISRYALHLAVPLFLHSVDQFRSEWNWITFISFFLHMSAFFLSLLHTHTHTLHYQPGDASVRCEQLDLLLRWRAEFRHSSSQPPEGEKVLEDLVAFDVILGDLNFDNCSSGMKLSELKHSHTNLTEASSSSSSSEYVSVMYNSYVSYENCTWHESNIFCVTK